MIYEYKNTRYFYKKVNYTDDKLFNYQYVSEYNLKITTYNQIIVKIINRKYHEKIRYYRI